MQKTGKHLYEEYKDYYLNHSTEKTEAALYAKFIYGLPIGFSCFKAFHYDEVYAKLEEAERLGKKLTLQLPKKLTTSSNDSPIISIPCEEEFCDDEAFWEITLV